MTNSNTRTMAFQIGEDLFQRIKAHLERETQRTGHKLTQDVLCKGWSHHLIHMTAVHLWQNEVLQLKERRWEHQKFAFSTTTSDISLQMKGNGYGTDLYKSR